MTKNIFMLRICEFMLLAVLVQSTVPLSMDVEWIIQGSHFAATGFVVEVLGISSALLNILPRSRVTKSYFESSLSENALVPHFIESLLPLEQKNFESLVDKYRPQSLDNPVKFRNISRALDSSVCQTHIEIESNMQYFELTRPRVNVESSMDCCIACTDDPLCIAWSFGCDDRNGCYLYGRSKQLKNGATVDTNASTLSCVKPVSEPLNPARLPAPRAIIFHGTSCSYNNETIDKLPRDINSLWIGRFMFERGGDTFLAGGISREEMDVLHCASKMDEVWVPTEWNKRAFAEIAQQMNLRLPGLFVIPEAVDSSLFRPDSQWEMHREKSATCHNTNTFQFLSVFKWEHRKGWDVLLEAYWTAFSLSDDVILRLHTYRPTFLQGMKNITVNIQEFALAKFGKSLEELAPLSIGDDHFEGRSASLTRAEIVNLYQQSDAFVLPTRGEGWCLPVAEAMSMEMPVIVSNYSGPAAYVNEDNGYLVSVTVRPDGYADPLVSSLIKEMLEVYRNRDEAKKRGQRARDTMMLISPDIVVGKMKERLLDLISIRGWAV